MKQKIQSHGFGRWSKIAIPRRKNFDVLLIAKNSKTAIKRRRTIGTSVVPSVAATTVPLHSMQRKSLNPQSLVQSLTIQTTAQSASAASTISSTQGALRSPAVSQTVQHAAATFTVPSNQSALFLPPLPIVSQATPQPASAASTIPSTQVVQQATSVVNRRLTIGTAATTTLLKSILKRKSLNTHLLMPATQSSTVQTTVPTALRALSVQFDAAALASSSSQNVPLAPTISTTVQAAPVSAQTTSAQSSLIQTVASDSSGILERRTYLPSTSNMPQ